MIIVHSLLSLPCIVELFSTASIGFLIHLIKWILDAKEGEDKGPINADSAIVCNCILDCSTSTISSGDRLSNKSRLNLSKIISKWQ